VRTASSRLTCLLAVCLASAGLGAAPDELPEIRVRASRVGNAAADAAGEVPGIRTRVSPNESLSRALASTPALVATLPGGESAVPVWRMRGMDPHQTRFFLDGFALTGAGFHASPAAWLPSGALGAAEIYPDAAPAAWGADGLGGAVNLVPSASTAVGARAGSFGYLEIDGSSRWHPDASVHLRYARSREDFPYRDDAGTPLDPSDDRWLRRAHNGFQRVSILPRGTLFVSGSDRISALGWLSLGELAVPGPTREPAAADLRHAFLLAGLKHEYSRDRARIETRLQGRWSHDELSVSGNSPLPGRNRETAAGVHSRAEIARGDITWIPGLGAGWDSLTIESPLASRTAGRIEIPLGIAAIVPAGPVELRPAVLASYYSYSDENHWLASPRLVAQARAGAFDFGLTAARLFRAPSLVERHGSPAGLAANPALVPETAWKVGASADWGNHTRGGTRRMGAALSSTWAKDLVAYASASPWTQRAVNIGSATVVSAELMAEGEIGPGLRTRAGLGWLHAINTTGLAGQSGKRLPYRPAYAWNTTIEWQHGKLRLGYRLDGTGPLFTDLINDLQVGGIVLHSASAGWDSDWGSWTLEAENLSDVASVGARWGGAELTVNHSAYPGYPAPGRRVYLRWRYSL